MKLSRCLCVKRDRDFGLLTSPRSWRKSPLGENNSFMSEKVAVNSRSPLTCALEELSSSPKVCEWHGNGLASIDFRPPKWSYTGTPNLEIFFLSSPLCERIWFLLSGQLLLSQDAFRPSSWRTNLCVLFIASLNDTIWVQQTFVVSRSSVFFQHQHRRATWATKVGVNRQSEDPRHVCVCEASLLIFLRSCGQIVLTREISADCDSDEFN